MKKIFMHFPTGIKIVLIAGIYFIIAVSGLQYSFQSSNATPLWPASGFAFAAVLLGGVSLSPGIFIGAFAANFYVFLLNNTCTPLTASWVSTIIGLGNTAEALTGYYLLRKIGPAFPIQALFKKVHFVFRFLLISLLMCLTSSIIGATSLLLAGIIPSTAYHFAWFTWWTGDVTGVILVTPFILMLANNLFFKKEQNPAGLGETIVVIGATIVISGIVFLDWFKPSFLFTRAFIIIPFLIWSAIRLAAPLVTGLLLVSAISALGGTLQGIGPFVAPTVNESLLTAALFISINSIMALIIKAAMTERWDAHLRLRSSRDRLEQMVGERTKELETKNKELERRNQELASFNHAVSHDLQEPLRKILTFGDSLLRNSRNELPESDRTLLIKIQSASTRMKKLLENLLSYLRLDNKERVFDTVDLNEVLNSVQNDLAENISKENAIIDSSLLPIVKGISFQFEQLFTNLLSNALKFRKKEMAPHITIKSQPVEGMSIEKHINTPGKYYHHLTFTDNGIGFREEYADKIFEIFQRLHAQSEFAGTGMGLAICKKIVENHNGYIYATSVPGERTTIHIYLPMENPYPENNHAIEKTISTGMLS
ncbi:sensor histidine kinase [Terrimonas alba]|uniref:sensor histidine kinase n=1 Tax=Terrimonas alba TaxID=3349636 RepID=UPI0035F38A0A